VALNYNSPHVNTTQVAGATAIAASGNSSILVGSSSWGSLASDYSLTQPSILNAPASITPRMGIPMATISGSVTKMYDGTTSAPGATLSGTVNNAITGDTFSFDISSLTFSYAFSQSGVNSVRVAVPANYVPTLTANSVSKQTDYTLQPFTIAPATGYIIPVVTVSIPSIAPAITVAAPASTASSGNASTGGGAGGNNASKGDGSSSSGSGSSGSNNSADPAGDNSQ
jgi:uncharacterized membrane protein YgcG